MRLLRTMPDRVTSLLPNGLLKELQEDEDKSRGGKTKKKTCNISKKCIPHISWFEHCRL